MNVKKKCLAFLSRENSSVDFHLKMFKQLFDHEVIIEPFLLSDKIDTDIPLVLVSHYSYYSEARLLFPKSKIISGEKILSGLNLEKIIMLPAGKKVIVINTPLSSAIDTIDNFIELGITHLDYIPFAPGDTCPPDVYAAISPGLIDYCPPHIDIRIDVGFRIFNIATFNKLFQELKLPSHYLDKVTHQIKLPLFLSNNKLVESLEKSALFDKERELIVNKIPDSVLFVSSDKKIIFLNREMEGAIRKNKQQIIGKDVSEVIRAISNNKDLIYNLDEEVNAKILLDGREYIYNCTTVAEGKSKQYVFTFKLVKKISSLQNTSLSNYKKYGLVAKYNFEDFWGESEEIAALKRRAQRFAQNDMTILISGESGTGKEILAQSIHNASMRFNAPFLAVNFAAIPENLIESELFGYEGGAFTGARHGGKLGYFEIAKEGTIFIDEIGDMPLSLQTRLLRILQEKEIIRIGGSCIIPINVRIIAATNVDLKWKVAEGAFRKDLYFRLNVLSLSTPPLREFKCSINTIMRKYLMKKYNFKMNLDKTAESTLQKYSWPGNVRELLNVADYMFYSAEEEGCFCSKDIPPYILQEIPNSNIFIPQLNHCYANKLSDNKNIHIAILNIFCQTNNYYIGRDFIKKELQKGGLNITEHYIKIIVSQMKKAGLIETGTTRQGSHITEKGYAFLTEAIN